MKTRCSLAGALAVLALFAAPLPAETTPSEIQATFVDPDAPEARSYRDVGSWAIDRLAMTMITDVASAVARKGAVESLPICHLKDLPITAGTVAGMGRVTAMKLTSLQLRNPANAPDAADQLALDKVKLDLEYGTPPKILIQRIERAAGRQEWRVYKPLVVIRQCGNCHSNPDQQPAELRTALTEKYPSDQASSFRVGEWRGLIRVTVADPAPVSPPASKAPPPAARPSKS